MTQLQLLFLEGRPEQSLLAGAEAAMRGALAGLDLKLHRSSAQPISQLMSGDRSGLALLESQPWDLVLLSLSTEMEATGAGAPDLEARENRWRELIAQLKSRADTQVVLSNIFRHVPPSHPRKLELRGEVRALNAMARRLSHRWSCFVLDNDRELSHEGGLALGADCFGGTERAAAVVAEELKKLAQEMLGHRIPEVRGLKLSILLAPMSAEPWRARVHRVCVQPGAAVQPGSALFELRIELGQRGAQDCPPLFHQRLIATERAFIRELRAKADDELSPGGVLAICSTASDEPIDPALPGRPLRCTAISIQVDSVGPSP